MPVQSKMADPSAQQIIQDLLIGNNKRKLVSATILLIIGFLIHIKNKKPEVDSLKLSRLEKEKTKPKVSPTLFRAAKVMLTAFSSNESKN